ncbi:beta-ketoacyl-[acyl-carrier-protein] synthase family protein [Ostreiculturibacter nitratireducens]|uniref:beta-ketoacyl-[acyl-carrier-protein] synthase family protein n=1 Tax=Ostreiculturibacter nitratireducens TaxID=3075226 RepID=UPI0031B5B887
MRRVVITGAGTVNPLGQDVPTTLAALREGRSGIGPLEFRDVERLSVRIGGQVRGWDPEAHFGHREIGLYDRVTQFALVAAQQAVDQSGLSFDGALADQAGVVFGCAAGGLGTLEDSYRAVFAEGKNRVHPLVVPRLMNNAAASHIAIRWNLRGPNLTISTACASSNQAMGLAFQMVRTGASPVMVTGGSEASLCFGGIKGWEGLRVMSHSACRPFSANRDGMVHGEGAGVFVFEDLEHARRRGAVILAEVAGFGMTSDASDVLMPSSEGAERAITAALRDAGFAPEDVGYINAHGTGTAANDRAECTAIERAFGPAAEQLMISSTKAMHGHLIGGTGAVELLPCLMALNDGIIAPTIGHEEPDPDCSLDVVPNEAREAEVSAVLSNAFAFGGLNAVIALKKI